MASVGVWELSKVFAGGIRAVDGLSLAVADGELFCLVGPSGCGKTTTLRMLAGLEQPTSGRISIAGRDVTDLPPRVRNIALASQHDALWPHMTVRENLEFGLRVRGAAGPLLGRLMGPLLPATRRRAAAEGSRRIGQQVLEVAALLGIERLLDRRPGELSGGERRRIALGRALVRRPSLMLLDEPLANLDGPLRTELRRELRRWHDRLPITTIHVTHDQDEALSLPDRIGVMDQGRLRQVGTPAEIYDRPVDQFVAGFIGSPTMNFIEGSLQSDGRTVQCPWGALAIPATRQASISSGARIVVGIRPEHIGIRAEEPSTCGAGPDPLQGPVGLLHGSVHQLELTGSEVLAAVAVGGVLIRAQCKRDPSLRPGSAITLIVPGAALHLFDARTGLAL